MKGVYLINEIGGKKMNANKDARTLYCQKVILNYMEKNHIQPVKLNAHQINDYYTIPHALLYDLKHTKMELDYLIIYSRKEIEEFIYHYPAKWLLLKSYFAEVLFVMDKEEHLLEDII